MIDQKKIKKNSSHAGSTQKFIEIQDIIEDLVFFYGGYACIIIEVQATNFALLSDEEAEARIFSYAGLLNSLSFSIQILIRSKKIDIFSYVKLLDDEIQKRELAPQKLSENQHLMVLKHMRQYRMFVQDLVKVNTVLDKKFYIVIPYSYLEGGVSGATGMIAKKSTVLDKNFVSSAKASLHTKADSLLTQLTRINLRAKALGKEELIKLFYSIYNEEQGMAKDFANAVKAPIIRSEKYI